MAKKLSLRRIEVGSAFIYPSRPSRTDAEDVVRAFIINNIKRDRPFKGDPRSGIEYVVKAWIAPRSRRRVLAGLFGSGGMLVPMPGSGRYLPGSLWSPMRICQELVSNGIGDEVQPCIKRHTAVPKSAFARPGERPTAKKHYQSTELSLSITAKPSRIVLVDDVVTKGATFIGCGSHLRDRFPDLEIVAFAIARTELPAPPLQDAKEALAPAVEKIKYFAGSDECYRND